MPTTSPSYTSGVQNQLNSLLRMLRTSTREYVSVVDVFPNREGRNLVRLFMKEREPIAEQLLHTIRHLGGDPTDSNFASATGDLRSEWDDGSSNSMAKPEVLLLRSCESMDAQLVSEYDELLNSNNHHLPYAYVEILRIHRNTLATEVENLGAYRHSLEKRPDRSQPSAISAAPQLDPPALARTV